MPEGSSHETPSTRSKRAAARHALRLVLRPVLVSLAYLAGYMALDVATEGLKGSLEVSLWFPPVGLTFALLLVFGWRYAPTVALVFLLHLILFRGGLSYPAALLFAIPVCYAALYTGAAVLLTRVLKIEPRLVRLRDVVWFVVVACFSVPLLVSATVVSGMVLAGYVPPDAFWENLLGFWAGDATGIAVLTSFLLVASRPFTFLWAHRPGRPVVVAGFRPPSRRELPEAVLQVLTLALSLAAAYGVTRGASLDYAYLAFTPLVWVALRGGFERATVAVLLINVGVVVLVGGAVEDAHPTLLQFGLMALTLVGLLLGAQTNERGRAEEAVGESERRFRSVVHNSSEAVTILDPDGTLRYASPAFERLFGYGPEEVVGKNINDYIHPEDLPRVAEGAEEALAEPGMATNVAEHRLRHKDGSWRHVEAIGTYLLDDPAVRGVVVNARDITERKEAEEALKKREERFRQLAENIREVFWTISVAERRLLYVSPAFEEVWGRSPEDLFVDPDAFLDTVHPDDRARVARGRLTVHLGEFEDEYRIVRPDGEVRWIRDRGFPVRGADGEVDRTVGVAEDITGRKRAEESLKESEQRFRSMIQNASDNITILDPDGTILYDSPAVERVLGYGPEERIGESAFDYIHPEDVERMKGTFAETLDAPGDVQPPVEFRVRHKDGSWRHMEVTRSNLLDDPAVRGIVANARDVTERKEAEEALKESEERYRAVVEQSTEAIWLFDPDTKRVLESNTPFQELLGYSEEELLDMTNYDFVAHSDEEVDRAVNRKVRKGRTYPSERKYRRKDGTLLDVEVNGTLISYGGKEVVCSVARDLTERKEAEEALRQSEERFRTIFEGSPVGMTLADADRGLIETNLAYQEMVGYGGEELSGKNLADITHPEDVEEDVAVQREVVRGERDRRQREKRYVREDGEVVWARVTFSAVRDEVGDLRFTIGVAEDITERKEAEDALKQSEERFRGAFENAPIGVALIGLDGRRLRVNQALCEMLGYSEKELLSKEDYLEDVHPDDREISRECTRQALDEGPESYTLERRYVRADGRVVWNLTSASLVRDSAGEPSHFVCLHQDVTERRALEERLEHQAFHDTLTGLPNRALLLDRLKQALARAERRTGGRGVAVLFMDLDNFKVVNDSLGHEAGDDLLVEAARRLEGLARSGDTVARLGGDEFCVLLEDANAEEAARVAGRALTELGDAPFLLGETEGERRRRVFVTASIGVALSRPYHLPSDLLKEADLAMYRAKEEGKGRHAIFEPHLSERVRERARLEEDLRRAIERGEIELYYQPKVCLRTGRIPWMEALPRWKHPERGLLLAGEFVPLAEETGLIVQIGRWTLEEALRQGRRWREKQEHATGNGEPSRGAEDRPPPPGMCVNLSARQLVEEGFVEEVRGLLARTGTGPRAFSIEITESVLIEDGRALPALEELRGMGIKLSIDDFGTGYSSFSYLKKFPADLLEIDCSFIEGLGEDPEEAAVVSGIVALAHATGKGVVAECVEDARQAALLREMGCEMGQGNHFSEPLPAEAATRLVESYQPEGLLPGRRPGSGPP